MSDQKAAGWIKPTLEFGPLVLFFLLYFRWRDQSFEFFGTSYEGFILASAVFAPVVLVATVLSWKLTGSLSKMQVFSAVLIVFFAALTVIFNDKSFVKMKPTVLYMFFGAALTVGLMRGQSYLQTIMDDALPLTDEGWIVMTKRIAVFFFALAALNEVIWRLFSDDTWVYFKTIGLPVLTIIFFIAQAGLFQTDESDEKK